MAYRDTAISRTVNTLSTLGVARHLTSVHRLDRLRFFPLSRPIGPMFIPGLEVKAMSSKPLRRVASAFAFFLVMFFLLAVCTSAQYRAGIQGSVLDPQGDAINGATGNACQQRNQPFANRHFGRLGRL